jgi:peroxiredoxin
MTASPKQNINLGLKKVLIPIVIILTLVVIGLTYLKLQLAKPHAEGPAAVDVKVGSVLPSFSLTSSPDNRSVPISDIGAQVIVLNFWATWCDACMEEMPSFVQLRNRFHKQGLEIVGINLDENPDGAIEKTKTKYKIEFPLFKDVDGKVAELFDIHAIPATIVFDKNRKVIYLKEGGQDWFSKEVIQLLQRWLAP